ncbi:MAG: tetratricopeptide repeat protein [Candidatus Thorarchaeota archaeon]|nr:MAG: tetratricopeptide repeat protein [Candidatus Thorarchaeota archaeon]
MYKHFDPSDRIFVNREQYLEWMDEALKRCKDRSVVLHLRGIGGIGKSSLLNYWTGNIDSTICLDCQQYTKFYDRLDILARGAVRIGLNLRRFDILWHIRKRFVEGVEPAAEKGREWAKDILASIPFIGSLAGIGSAIKSIGDSVAPKLRSKYGEVGHWLQERLGANYVERLLEILWKEPHHAEFLYLDALTEDINNRKNMDEPILLLFDHSENVDSEDPRWKYGGKKITEVELWYVFLSSLENCVGVVASRNAAPDGAEEEHSVERSELTELDRDSSIELLQRRNVIDSDLQERIVSVSGGNPFVLDAICDMLDTGGLSASDVETLRADTLHDVRLKTWRRLFSKAKDLLNVVDRAGLLPFFDRNTLDMVAPDMKTDQWERFIRLSFVKVREDGTMVLHDLARELVRAELGKKLKPVVDEVTELLEKASVEESNPGLLGFSYSVKALASEADGIREAKEKVVDLLDNDLISEAEMIVRNLMFVSLDGQAELHGLRGKVYQYVNRWPEAEVELQEAIRILEEVSETPREQKLASIAEFNHDYADVLFQSFRFDESGDLYEEALEIQRRLVAANPEPHLKNLGIFLKSYSYYLYLAHRPLDGIKLAQEALGIFKELEHPTLLPASYNMLGIAYANAGRFADSREAYQEGVAVTRRFLQKHPENRRLKALLVSMMGNMSLFLTNESETETYYDEASKVRRELAEKGTEHLKSRLGRHLLHRAWFYLRTHDNAAAAPLLDEAHDIFSSLSQESPTAWQLDNMLGAYLRFRMYFQSGRVEEAQAIVDGLPTDANGLLEAPDEFLLFYSNLLALMHSLALRQSEADMVFRQGIESMERIELSGIDILATTICQLINYSGFLLRIGQASESKEYSEKALKEIEGLDLESLADRFKGSILLNLATALKLEDEKRESQNLFEKAIGVMEDAIVTSPGMFSPYLAVLLNNYSSLLRQTGNLEEAESNLLRAIEIKNQLVEDNPDEFESTFSTSLVNYGILLTHMDRSPEAEGAFRQALEIRRELVKKQPGWHLLELAIVLHNYGVFLEDAGTDTEAKKHLEESAKLRSQIARTAPDIIRHAESLISDTEGLNWWEADEITFALW